LSSEACEINTSQRLSVTSWLKLKTPLVDA